jgi:trk system potassium uptake protein TrkH
MEMNPQIPMNRSSLITIASRFFGSPGPATVFGFLAMIVAGTCLLLLPQATCQNSLSVVDALFTATSSVCVTGLAVTDTGTSFTLFGQGIILVLIQTGGLGIMTLSTLFLVLSGKRLSFNGHSAIQESFTPFQDRPPGKILRDLIFFTLVLEGLGAVLLFTGFMNSAPLPRALYLSVFHSISAFCNAGFSLFPDSFTAYKSSVVVNLTICALIIFGGIGFPVLSELKDRFLSRNKKRSPMSLHAKLVLSMTGVMLVAGTLVFLTMESRITLQKLPWLEKIVASLFLSVNARTAGFNSLALGNMANETLLFMILLMFVGASPGSCGGGIKTTCLATLVALGRSRLKGEKRPNLFGRSLSDRSVGRAVSVVLISTLIVCAGTMLLLMTELGDLPHPQSRGMFLELLFEVVSAFGTVGLSTGVTPGLSDPGKLIIISIMFLGRLGPLLIAMAVSRPVRLERSYAEEEFIIG